RPTFVGWDLDALHTSQPEVEVGAGYSRCENVTVQLSGEVLVPHVSGSGGTGARSEVTALLRASVALGWAQPSGATRLDPRGVEHLLAELVQERTQRSERTS